MLISVFAPLWHPLGVVSTLIQLGNEPVPPRKSYSTISHQYFWYYPQIFGYSHGINLETGLLGLYHGLVPSVIENVVWCAMLKYSMCLVQPVVNYLLPEAIVEVNLDNLCTNRNKIREETKLIFTSSLTGWAFHSDHH